VSKQSDSSANNIIRTSAEAMRKLSSVHLMVLVKGKFERFGPVTKVDGDVRTTPLMANGFVTYENGVVAPFVVDKDVMSVKLGGEWSEVGTASDFIPASIADPNNGMTELLNRLVDVKSDGSEAIDGVRTNKISGTILPQQDGSIAAELSGPAEFKAWIRADAQPVLVRAVIDISSEKSLTVTMSKWNLPVSLAPATPN